MRAERSEPFEEADLGDGVVLGAVHFPEVLIFKRLWTACSKRHSQLHACNPRRLNRPAPRCRVWPNTGSIVPPRFRYSPLPRLVWSLRSMRCFPESPWGIGPRGGGLLSSRLRFFVAIRSSTPRSRPRLS